jgi:hypothetical protein
MAFFWAPQRPATRRYFVAPLAGAEGLAAVPASGAGVGVGLVLLPMEPLPVDGVEGVDGDAVPGDDVAPVSSTFLPQAPNASKAAKARAVAAAVLDLDASMSVSFFRK